MADVTCSRCWLWQPLGRSTTCRACGAPLIFQAGMRVDQARAPQAPPPAQVAGAMVPEGPAAGPPPYAPSPWVPAGYMAGQSAPVRGVDWVLWVRIGIAVPAALSGLLLLVVGLVVRHLTLPATAGAAAQTVDVSGQQVAIVFVLLLGLTALFVWLAQFAAMRALMLALVLVNVIEILSRLSGATPDYRIVYLIDLGWDIVFGALLCLSLAALPRRSR